MTRAADAHPRRRRPLATLGLSLAGAAMLLLAACGPDVATPPAGGVAPAAPTEAADGLGRPALTPTPPPVETPAPDGDRVEREETLSAGEGAGHPDRYEITVEGDPEPVARTIEALGGQVELISHDRIQAVVPPEAIERLRRDEAVVKVERPALVVPFQSPPLTSLAAMGADHWHEAGFSGHGVRLAILDTGFRGYEAELGTTLPAGIVARSFRADGSLSGDTNHGLRAAQIAHQVAPGARLYLVNFLTVTELSAAVDWLIEQQVDIVSFSLGFIHNGPGDGTGPVNEIVSRSTDAGVFWAVAAGNWAQQHWSGVFRDADGDSIHEFANNTRLNGHEFSAGDLIQVSLRWDDEWGAACSDYDLELFGPDGALVQASRAIQDCSGDPVESLQVLATRSGTYSVRIIEADAEEPKRLSLLVVGSPDRGRTLDFFTPQGSLAEPADHPDVFTVGAISTGQPRREASFSSRGPTADGRPKPNVLAPTGGANAPAGQVFAGTSAAAPHAAGAAALMAEAFPGSGGLALAGRLSARGGFADESPNGSPGVRLLNLGSLAGLGPLLPAGAVEARLDGSVPASAGIALLVYGGPDVYPVRFAHRLVGGRNPHAVFRYDAEVEQWDTYIRNAPAFVNTLAAFDDGDILFVRLGPVEILPGTLAGRTVAR